MRHIDVLHLGDQSIKNTIKTSVFPPSLPDDQKHQLEKLLDAAFDAGHITWLERYIPIILGVTGAERERELLYSQIDFSG
jgi:hypothetical protein